MAEFDWKIFTVRVPVNASAEKLYWCWATREGIEYWFLRMSDYRKPDGTSRNNDEYVQKGDTYAWRWFGWSDEVTEHGEILDCNGKDFFKFSFGKAGICAVSIKNENLPTGQAGGQNIVELMQDEIPDNEQGRHFWHLGCKIGWTFYLANLKSLLEGGIDLRNRDEGLKNVINS